MFAVGSSQNAGAKSPDGGSCGRGSQPDFWAIVDAQLYSEPLFNTFNCSIAVAAYVGFQRHIQLRQEPKQTNESQ
jgi:hypothetical protein